MRIFETLLMSLWMGSLRRSRWASKSVALSHGDGFVTHKRIPPTHKGFKTGSSGSSKIVQPSSALATTATFPSEAPCLHRRPYGHRRQRRSSWPAHRHCVTSQELAGTWVGLIDWALLLFLCIKRTQGTVRLII